MDNAVEFKKEFLVINGKRFVPYIHYEEIRSRCEELAQQIESDYSGRYPVFVVVLKGAIFFAAELIKNIFLPLRIETLKARSYRDKMESSGKVELFLTCDDLTDKDLIIVEDIIDTGLTMSTIIEELRKYNPKSIELAACFLKPKNLKCDLKIKYCGFEIPEKFVIGFGLDYAEFGRNLKDVYILE
jgi:hypoxanthine phosphoribosyltransferase